jgi:hypothetical protein
MSMDRQAVIDRFYRDLHMGAGTLSAATARDSNIFMVTNDADSSKPENSGNTNFKTRRDCAGPELNPMHSAI